MANFSYTRSTIIVSNALAPVQLLQGHNARLAVIFTTIVGTTVGLDVSADGNLFAPMFWLPQLFNLQLTYKDVGPLVTGQWWATIVNAPGFVTVTEIFTVPGSF